MGPGLVLDPPAPNPRPGPRQPRPSTMPMGQVHLDRSGLGHRDDTGRMPVTDLATLARARITCFFVWDATSYGTQIELTGASLALGQLERTLVCQCTLATPELQGPDLEPGQPQASLPSPQLVAGNRACAFPICLGKPGEPTPLRLRMMAAAWALDLGRSRPRP